MDKYTLTQRPEGCVIWSLLKWRRPESLAGRHWISIRLLLAHPVLVGGFHAWIGPSTPDYGGVNASWVIPRHASVPELLLKVPGDWHLFHVAVLLWLARALIAVLRVGSRLISAVRRCLSVRALLRLRLAWTKLSVAVGSVWLSRLPCLRGAYLRGSLLPCGRSLLAVDLPLNWLLLAPRGRLLRIAIP